MAGSQLIDQIPCLVHEHGDVRAETRFLKSRRDVVGQLREPGPVHDEFTSEIQQHVKPIHIDADCFHERRPTSSIRVASHRGSVGRARHGCFGGRLPQFCLFVSLTACTVAIESFAGASGSFGLWNAVNWTVWALLWFCFFLLLGLSRSIQKPVAYLTLASAIFTAWLPGLLLLGQVLKA